MGEPRISRILYWAGGSLVAAGCACLLAVTWPAYLLAYVATHTVVPGRVLSFTWVASEMGHRAHMETLVQFKPTASFPTTCTSIVETPLRMRPIFHPGQVVDIVARGQTCGSAPPIILATIGPIMPFALIGSAFLVIGAALLLLRRPTPERLP